ncbi:MULTISPECIES: DUF6157 family protein [Sphingobacterium]|uniref:DUF6157 family protein n=1 Tax=Sphingobacterium TaxID=28453 RepID=UPI0022444FC7|nr:MULTISPECIES: DUF6157 family protein [Sphingobacterium]MCW8311910.1 DUF6157 family protein [Sphingobacterium sp. InxBP1]
MKVHSTNYYNTFIEVAGDSKVSKGTIPPITEKKTIARLQYEIITESPYTLSSDDVLFQLYAERNGLPPETYAEARALFFSKGQPCLRTSPLSKKWGFGIHHNNEGKIALYGVETEEYRFFLNDSNTLKVKAMRSRK